VSSQTHNEKCNPVGEEDEAEDQKCLDRFHRDAPCEA